MTSRHTVRFEPVEIEIEVDEDETILEAAFRQGLVLAHGCKEGQCSACKSFLLAGDVELERYSTFALADYEKDDGYTLLCRAHAYSHLEVELLHYDLEMLNSGLPIRTLATKVHSVEALTHDVYKLSLALEGEQRLQFHAGQYVEIEVPGTAETRAFSMANTPAVADRLEFMIKAYPGGRFSTLLEGALAPGDDLRVKGPYGVFILREHSDADLIFIGGGAGMAPIWSLLSALAEARSTRRVSYYYGARTRRDLFQLREIERLSDRLPRFRFIAALSAPAPEDDWQGELGLITDVVDRLESDLSGADGYVCGPPAMVDAALSVLGMHGLPEGRTFYDRFTIATSEGEPAHAPDSAGSAG